MWCPTLPNLAITCINSQQKDNFGTMSTDFGQVIIADWVNIGISKCEDLWDKGMFQNVDVKDQVRLKYLNFDVNVLKQGFLHWVIVIVKDYKSDCLISLICDVPKEQARVLFKTFDVISSGKKCTCTLTLQTFWKVLLFLWNVHIFVAKIKQSLVITLRRL